MTPDPNVPRHEYVPDDPHYETDDHDTCQFEWDWPLKSGGVSRTRCRSPLWMHVQAGWQKETPDGIHH